MSALEEIENEEGGEGQGENDNGQKQGGDEGGSPEERAARMGWKPQEDYKGKPEEWVSAEEFLKRTEEEGPFLKKALKNMERKYEKLEKNTEAILAHQNRQIEAAEKQGYDRAMQEINRQMAKAVEEGDLEAHDAALKKRDEIQKKNQEGKGKDSAIQAAVDAWRKENEWYDSDPILRDYALKYCDMLAEQGKSPQEQLEGAAKYIRTRFPQMFDGEDDEDHENRSNNQAPLMKKSTNGINKQKPKGRLYDNLNAQSKAECDRFVKEMTGRNKNTKAEDARSEWMRFATDDMFTNLN